MSEKTEKVKIVPNPETVEEETETKPKFPSKLVRNVVIGASAAAITGYIACKLRSKDEDEDSDFENPWIDVLTTPSQTSASE